MLFSLKKPVLKIFFTEKYVKFGHFFTKGNFFFRAPFLGAALLVGNAKSVFSLKTGPENFFHLKICKILATFCFLAKIFWARFLGVYLLAETVFMAESEKVTNSRAPKLRVPTTYVNIEIWAFSKVHFSRISWKIGGAQNITLSGLGLGMGGGRNFFFPQSAN